MSLKKETKVVDKNVTQINNGAYNYIIVPVSSTSKMPDDFVTEFNKRWINLEKDLRVAQSNKRLFVAGTLSKAFVQTTSVVVFANCLKDDNTVDNEALEKCLKALWLELKMSPGQVIVSSKFEPILGNLEQFLSVFSEKNVQSVICN